MAPRKQISLQAKLDVIKDVDAGMKQVEISKKYGFPQSTIATFLKKRKEIEQTVSSSEFDPVRKRMKTACYEDIDAATMKWFREKRALNIPINGPMLCEQARKFASMLNINDFKGSNGWLVRFRDRHGIAFHGIHGEEYSVPMNDVNEWRQQEIKKLYEKYSPDNIYNADETGLFFQLLPDRTLGFKGEGCKGGKKSKQRLTVLLCSNFTGTHKLKPLVIGKSMKPRCFKNIQSLPVDYSANIRSWMTEKIFNEWLLKLDKEMIQKKRKIALLVDNCTAHKSTTKLENIELIYFPPNCTSVLQPLDMGVIKCFKGCYRKHLVQTIIFNIDQKHPEPFNINVKEACDRIAGSWNEIKASTIRNCWRKAGFSFNETDEENKLHCENLSEEDALFSSLKTTLTQYEDVTGKKPCSSIEEYVNIDSELLVFAETNDEDIIAEITHEKREADEDEEEGNNDPALSEPLLTAEEAVHSIQAVQRFISILPNVPDDYLTCLESIRSLCVNLSVEKKRKQTKISDFF